jgi:ATP-dependent RNA helicase SUPV3L1/SUV3
LAVSQIKQIAGRAGRYRTADQDKKATVSGPTSQHKDGSVFADSESLSSVSEPIEQTENVGLVTARNAEDLGIIRRAMNTTAGPLVTAGLFPISDVIQRFCAYFPPATPYSYILMRLLDIAKVNPRFRLSGYENAVGIADVIQPIKNLTTVDRIAICNAPVRLRDPNSVLLIKEMASCVAENRSIGILDLERLDIDVLDEKIVPTREHLKKLESLHKGLVLYCWMSLRFPGVFIQRGLASHTKGLVETSIDTCLSKLPKSSRKK